MSWLSTFFDRATTMPGTHASQDAATQQQQTLDQQQAAHDLAVSQGKNAIDASFSQFTPDYYSGITKAYEDAYNPQLTDQFNIARDQLTAQLAGNDTLGGSVGNNAEAQLQKAYGSNQAGIASAGQDAANGLRANVDNAKTNLYSMNAAAADPLAAATQSQATAGTLVSPQSYPGLGNVFGAVLSPIAQAQKSNSNSLNGGQSYFSGPSANNPTQSSGVIS